MTAETTRQVCTFVIAEETYGVDILDVKEINPETRFTPVPHAPATVRGYVNIRGQIHLVLDLRRILGCAAKPEDLDSRIILFKPDVGEAFGILVDRIGDVITTETVAVEPFAGHIEAAEDEEIRKLAEGVIQQTHRLVILLSARSVLASIDGDLSPAVA